MNPTPDEIEKMNAAYDKWQLENDGVSSLRRPPKVVKVWQGAWLLQQTEILSLRTQLATAQQELARVNAEAAAMRGALVFYSNRADWIECTAQGNVGAHIHDGEPMMVFEPGQDRPWSIAKNALSSTAGVELLETKERYEKVLKRVAEWHTPGHHNCLGCFAQKGLDPEKP